MKLHLSIVLNSLLLGAAAAKHAHDIPTISLESDVISRPGAPGHNVDESALFPTRSPECNVDLAFDCVVTGDNSKSGMACDAPNFQNKEECTARPNSLQMKFTGGRCESSDNIQHTGQFECSDFNRGPPAIDGQDAYIVVTSGTETNSTPVKYFEGFVSKGEYFVIDSDDPERRFADALNIDVYSSADKNPSTLLQTVMFEAYCSDNSFLELDDVFGASTLVGFTNDKQGDVTSVVPVSFDLNVAVPVDFSAGSATLISLIVETDFAGLIDLTDQVAGMFVYPGGSVTIPISAFTIDLSERKSYTITSEITAVPDIPTGRECSKSITDIIVVG